MPAAPAEDPVWAGALVEAAAEPEAAVVAAVEGAGGDSPSEKKLCKEWRMI